MSLKGLCKNMLRELNNSLVLKLLDCNVLAGNGNKSY